MNKQTRDSDKRFSWVFWILLAVIVVLIYFAWRAQPINVNLQNIKNPFAAEPVPVGHYKVVEVADGDTIVIDMDGKHERVRFIGVDTPETHHPELPVQCFGQAASDFTKNLLASKSVRLEADSQSNNRDYYQRLLRYVYTEDGQLVNYELIAQGYGFAYLGFPFDKSADFKAAEVSARSENRGLWAGCKVNEQGRNPQTEY